MEREMAWTRSLELDASTPAARAAGLLVLPSFVSNSTEKIFAPRGGTATIECHVRHLGDRAVRGALHYHTITGGIYASHNWIYSLLSKQIYQFDLHHTAHTLALYTATRRRRRFS
jgi:hypothetical protein